MNPSSSQSEDQELLELQQALAELTVRVADLRNRRNPTQRETNQEPQRNQQQRTFQIGDRVYFQLYGRRTEGTIVDRTPRRFRIRHNGTGHIYLRSDTTITLIE
jgi:hypothetical protein